MISLQDIEKVYRTDTIETLALSKININIRKGEFVSVMGPSGCGKSTLLNIMGLLDQPSSGRLVIDQMPVDDYTDRRLSQFRNQKLGFIFQSFHLINDLCASDNVEIPLLYRQLGKKERNELIAAALDKVGLSNRAGHFPKQMSGGQKQRIAIARAIVAHPEIILADEPTGNLDSAMGHGILDLLQVLNNDGATIVMVTHDDTMAKRTGRIIRLFDGFQVH